MYLEGFPNEVLVTSLLLCEPVIGGEGDRVTGTKLRTQDHITAQHMFNCTLPTSNYSEVGKTVDPPTAARGH